MKIYNGLIKCCTRARMDKLKEKNFLSWKAKAETYYEGNDTIWKNFCRIEFINPNCSFAEFCKAANTPKKERKNICKIA